MTRLAAAAVAAAVLAARGLWWRSTAPTEVDAVVTNVRCAWAPLRLGDVIVTGRVANPSARQRDFALLPRVSLPGLGVQRAGTDTFVLHAHRSQGFWFDVATSRRSRPGGPIAACGAAGRSFTPGGED